jgi:hypothetical protein
VARKTKEAVGCRPGFLVDFMQQRFFHCAAAVSERVSTRKHMPRDCLPCLALNGIEENDIINPLTYVSVCIMTTYNYTILQIATVKTDSVIIFCFFFVVPS